MTDNTNHFYLSVFKCIVKVKVETEELFSVLNKVYGAMIISNPVIQPALSYIVRYKEPGSSEMVISREGINDLITDDLGRFIFLFEKDMTIELQKLRSDLLFIHSAALEYNNKALLLVAPSGTGKSTTTWAMVNSGFNYLSDELAPIDLQRMAIHPYPHAINLKAKPPLFELPDDTLYTSQTLHVPCNSFSNKINSELIDLNVIFFLEYDPELSEPEIIVMNKSEAIANLYANSLNILAHDKNDNGLHAAIEIVSNVKVYRLISNELEKTCKEIKSQMS